MNLAASEWKNTKSIFWSIVITILGIVCFPANPLVLTGILETNFYLPLFVIGCIVWAFGMMLVMAPIVMFPRRGGVPEGQSFVNATRIVDTRVYGVVRHPQYLGGILSIFVTTLLWYPHWLFGMLGFLGALVVYLGAREEDQRLVEQFGDEYRRYMQRVPGMNFLLGLVRLLQRRNKR
jgi:protein-S-isoprenylcysteine O-methyltransferase Ste14